MAHTRIRKFNTKDTYPEQNLDNDLCQAVVTQGGRIVWLRGQCPQNLDDACAIVRERPKYLSAMRRTEARWGVPVYVQMAVIHQESKFIGDAKTPFRYTLGIIPMGRQSSAYGYAQALDDTWEEYKRDTRNRGADRRDIHDATDFMGWYMNQTRRALGIPVYDIYNQYLAYHEGRGGYARKTYRGKPWLMSVANSMSARSEKYRAQLVSCRKI